LHITFVRVYSPVVKRGGNGHRRLVDVWDAEIGLPHNESGSLELSKDNAGRQTIKPRRPIHCELPLLNVSDDGSVQNLIVHAVRVSRVNSRERRCVV